MSESPTPTGYWSLIEPAFDAISIYDGPEVFRSQLEPYPQHVRNLLAAHWCQSEICNGGFNQLFSNATGVLFPEAIEGFRAIGLPRLTQLCEAAMSRWQTRSDRAYPRRREERLNRVKLPAFAKRPPLFRLLQWFSPPLDFSDLDQPFYDALNSTENFEAAANAYAKRFA